MADLIDIPSPCIGVCTLEADTGLCAGCLRTVREIGIWPSAGPGDRMVILDALRSRRRARGITSEADSRPRRRRRPTPVGG